MKLIVGLGNPGDTYVRTRHNVGFMVIDELARTQQAIFRFETKFGAEITEIEWAGQKVLLAKPQTFMNNSGSAAQKIARFYKLEATDIWAVYDDVDVPFGKIRTRLGGRGGGHQGVNSLIAHLGEHFGRARVGISLNDRTRESSEEYVLKPFNAQERPLLPAVIQLAVEILLGQLEAGQLTEQTYSTIS